MSSNNKTSWVLENSLIGPIFRFLYGIYYRYTIETGSYALEWWEIVLVNAYFLLLAYSVVTQFTGFVLWVYTVFKKLIIFIYLIFKSGNQNSNCL